MGLILLCRDGPGMGYRFAPSAFEACASGCRGAVVVAGTGGAPGCTLLEQGLDLKPEHVPGGSALQQGTGRNVVGWRWAPPGRSWWRRADGVPAVMSGGGPGSWTLNF